MFRPSQNLLFRPMPSLNKFKIHPPLPLNPRESKQLLNLLTTSFRQQLDVEHGEFRKDPKPSTTQTENEKPKRKLRSISDSTAQPTDRHMNSILTNPLFNLNADGKAQTTGRDPMEVFDLAVARGMMTINYARACLNAKKHEIIQSPVPTIREGMKESGAGLKVLKWLVSSGTANNNDFLMNAPFAQTLMDYLVAEGLQEVCWKWILRGFQSIPQYSASHGEENRILHKTLRRAIVAPLYHLVKAEASGDVSLDSAYLSLSRAVSYLAGSPAERLRDLLSGAGWFLVYESIKIHSERPPPSPSAFDSFYSIIPVLSKNPAYQLAHMSLIHPTKPSTDLSLTFLRQLSPGMALQNVKDHAHVHMGLDTAKALLENGRYKDAEWVMDFLRENYSRKLGIAERDQLGQAKAEAESLQLLEGLALI